MLKLLKQADLPAVTEIFYDAFTHPPWNYHWMTTEKAARYVRDLYRTPGSLSFMFIQDSKPAGFCLGRLDDYFEHIIYEIKEIAVSFTKQRKGLGSLILSAVESYVAKHHNTGFISLQTARHSPAYDFYIKNNYVPVEQNASLAKSL